MTERALSKYDIEFYLRSMNPSSYRYNKAKTSWIEYELRQNNLQMLDKKRLIAELSDEWDRD